MSGGTDARVKSIFVQAIELSGTARSQFLQTACEGDTALRSRVEILLVAAEEPDAFLRDPAIARPTLDGPAPESNGTTIGPYRLLELIGEGGFGSVFLAEQKEPVRRRVALKIIKLGMDTHQLIARFEQERQALAVMDHPNVARVLDAGATVTGRPYFVMEYVRGEPITTYCDNHALPIRDRIRLFQQVCAAVQHAHTKGIIHRDLKPGNILVTAQDGQPIAKVIDFGIAKAIDRPFTDKTLFTEMRQLVGTPEYMSPEQAEGSRDIDTRTDVYSLGVLLYELLSGTPPFDPQTLRSAAYAELQRLIREVDPPRPSTRLSQQSASISAVATKRGIEPSRLGTLLRGELDWIIMHAIEKDRVRRYQSPGALAADLTRYLNGEAVQAAPPSAMYRARKFTRRNRVAVVAAAGVGVALFAGLAMAIWQARTQARLAEAAIAAKLTSEKHQKEMEQVAKFQESQLKLINVEQMGKLLREDIVHKAEAAMTRAGRTPQEITIRKEQLSSALGDLNFTDVAINVLDSSIFDPSLKAVDEQFKDQPAIQEGLILTLAETMSELGMYDRATEPQLRGLALSRKTHGDDSIETINAIGNTAMLLKAQGKYADAETLYRECYERSSRTYGDNARTLTALNNLALILQAQNKLTEAEPLYRESLAKREKLYGPDSPEIIAAISNLGFLLVAQGKLSDAEPYLRSALEKQRKIPGATELDTLTMVGNLGAVLQMQGKFTDAEPLLRESVDVRRRLRGDLHAETLRAIYNLGVLMQSQEKMDEAEKLFKEALDGRRKTLKSEHPLTLTSARALGALYRSQGRLAEAEPLLREALDQRLKILGESHVDSAFSKVDMAMLLLLQNKPLEAEPLFRAAAATMESKLGPAHWQPANARVGLGECLAAQKKFTDAEPLLLNSEQILAKAKGAPPEAYPHCVDVLVHFYESWIAVEPDPVRAGMITQWKSKRAALKHSEK